MRKKNLYLSAFAALTAWGLTSCANDADLASTTSEKAQMNSVTFKISMPGGDPVHYTRAAIQDGNEHLFNTLKLLVYDAKDEKLLDVKNITTATGPTASGNDYEYTYTESSIPDGTLARRFVFLGNDAATDANLDKTADPAKTYADLANAKAAVAVAAEAQSTTFASGYLPMAGVAKTNGSPIINMSQSAAVAVDVALTRAVARIDVENNVPNLEITDLKLTNANPNGFLMQSGSAGSIAVPTGMVKVSNVQPYNAIASLTAASDNVSADGKFLPAEPAVGDPFVPAVLKKAFYVYEDVDNAAAPLTLLVQGKLSGTIGVYYQIPFIKGNIDGRASDAEDDEAMEILRNHLYKVTIGNGVKVSINTALNATISAAAWDANTDVPGTFYGELFTGVTNDVTGVSYNKVTQHFEIPAAALADGDGVSIDVADTYWDGGDGVTIAQVQVLTDGDWTTAASSGTSTSGWLTATFTTEADQTKPDATGKRIKISATENTTGSDRNGAIRFIYKNTSAGSADQKITFTITQKGS